MQHDFYPNPYVKNAMKCRNCPSNVSTQDLKEAKKTICNYEQWETRTKITCYALFAQAVQKKEKIQDLYEEPLFIDIHKDLWVIYYSDTKKLNNEEEQTT